MFYGGVHYALFQASTMVLSGQTPFRKFLESAQWQKSISGFSHLTGFTVKCIGMDGTIVGNSYGERELCRLIRKTGKGLKRCRAHCGRKIARTLREGEKSIFTCYAGLLCFSAPLRVNERVVGAVFGGKVLPDSPVLSHYVKLSETCQISLDLLFNTLGELKVGKVGDLEQAMHYLTDIGQILINHLAQSRRYGQGVSRLFTLFHLGNDLNLAMDSHELYGLVINTLSILFDLNGASLMLFDSSDKNLITQSYYGPEEWRLASYRSDVHTGVIGQVFRDHKPVFTQDRFQIEKSGFHEKIQSVYAFPLFLGQKIKGVICIYNSELDEDAVPMIRAFCNQIAIAIQNLELQRSLKNRILEITNLGMVTSEVGEARESQELFQLILNRSTEIVKAEQASLMILDESTKKLVIKACKGMPEKILRTLRIGTGEGIAGKVMESGTPLLVTDIERDPKIHQKKKMRYKTGSFICIPLTLQGRTIGVLNISDKVTGEIFNEDDLKIMKIFAAQATIALERTKLYNKSKEMEQVLITDHLTGLLNRRYFFERTTEEIVRAQRHSHPLSLMMIDVDDFKWYNDNNGHLAGDDALRSVAAVIRDTIRNIDFVARYGGEEFTVVLPQTSKREAVMIGERLRKEVETFYFPYEENQPLGNFTISMGLATYPEDARNIKELIEAADKALYRSKAAGKNRISLYRRRITEEESER